MGCAQSAPVTLLTAQGPVKAIQNIKEDLNNVDDFVKAINKALLPKLQEKARRQLIQKALEQADLNLDKVAATKVALDAHQVATAFKATGAQAVDAIQETVPAAVDADQEAVPAAVDAVQEAVPAAVDAVQEAVAPAVDAGQDAAAGAVQLGQKAITACQKADVTPQVAIAQGAGAAIGAAEVAVKDAVQDAVPPAVDAVQALFQALHSKLSETRKAKLKMGVDVFLSERSHRDAFRRACATRAVEVDEDLSHPEQLVSALEMNLNPKQMRNRRRAFVQPQLSVEQMEAERQAQELDDYWRPEMAQARKDDIKAALVRAQDDENSRLCFQEAYHAHRLNKALTSALNPEPKLVQAERDELLRPFFVDESSVENLAALKQTFLQELEQDPRLDPVRKAELTAAIDVHCADPEHLAALRSGCERFPVEVPIECQDLPLPADDDDELSDLDNEEWIQERSKYARLEPLQQVEPTPVENAQPVVAVVEGLVDGEESRLPPNDGEAQVEPLTSLADQLKLTKPETTEHVEKQTPGCIFCQG